MVVPISFNPNFFPEHYGKKVSGRKDGQVNFDDFLLERMEPVDSTPESGRDQEENAPRQERRKGAHSMPTDEQETDLEKNSQGGEYSDGPPPGRRIDLRA